MKGRIVWQRFTRIFVMLPTFNTEFRSLTSTAQCAYEVFRECYWRTRSGDNRSSLAPGPVFRMLFSSCWSFFTTRPPASHRGRIVDGDSKCYACRVCGRGLDEGKLFLFVTFHTPCTTVRTRTAAVFTWTTSARTYFTVVHFPLVFYR